MGLDQLEPFISKEIQAKVRGNFADPVIRNTFLKIQALNDNSETIKGKIDQFVGDILSPKNNYIVKNGIVSIYLYVKVYYPQGSI